MSKDLRGADLTGASLWGADLTGADLRDANLTGADLYRVNLRGADLTNAILTNANLHDTIGDGKVIKTIILPKYTVNIVKSLGVIQIGCQRCTVEGWFSFTDGEISNMDDGAVRWWHKHKQTIKQGYDNV